MPKQANGHEPTVQVVLQAKGGVGKSYVAATLAQYYSTRQWKVRCFDTDPGKTTSQKSIVVWLNEFFGEVREGSRSFEQFKLAQDLAPKLVGCVLIRKRNPDTFEDDVQQMLRGRLTFDEAIGAEDFSLVSKQRLQIIRRELFEQLDELDL